ncbi:phage portal protein [Kroppenstedtia sanguinis]|uniref:Phage portal protein n=1 Tax=Kroppenstedtia sanguinis TaxID=1380684 RepID=A0ABW4C623_9BACL
MLKSLWAKVRQVMYRMGLIRGIKKVTQQAEFPVDDSFYQEIDKWHHIYRGYHKDWHEVVYQTVAGQKRRRLNSLGMAKVAAEEMANLIFNEKCEIHVSDEQFSEELQEILDDNRFYHEFQDSLEYMFALGGLVWKVQAVADRTGEQKLKLTYVTADCFLPLSYSNGDIQEGVFVNSARKGDKHYTLLEWHQWEGTEYVVRNQLYESDTAGELGVPVALETLYPGLEPETRIVGLSRPLFVYFRPNIANNIDPTNPLGVSIYANALDTLHALDVAFDSFMREFRLGKRRIIVPASAVKTVIDTESGEPKRYFDANDEVFVALNSDMANGQQIIDNTVELRVEEHAEAIQAYLDILAMQIGFSAGAFTFDSQGVKTATEVVSENSKTFRTKNSHETIVEEGLKNLITSVGEVAALYGMFIPPAEYDVTVDFDDSIAEDRDSNADYYLKLQTASLISKKYALMKILHLTEEQAEQMLDEIREERETDMPGIDALFGGDMGGKEEEEKEEDKGKDGKEDDGQ